MNFGSPNLFYQQLLAGSSGSVAAALVVSLVLGAIHGVSPGHGKTLVVASLLGSRGSVGRVLLLAVTVAVTHTIGVLVLAAIVLGANQALLPAQLTPYLSLAADILVLLFGADLVRRARWARAASSAGADHDHADHDHADHDHPHTHPHPHLPAGLELTRGYTVSIGIVGGLAPNGTALVVLLMAIALHQFAIGVLLVLTFGLGIALVMGAVGVATVIVRRRGGHLASPGGRLGRLAAILPLASGLAVMAVGAVLTVTAVAGL